MWLFDHSGRSRTRHGYICVWSRLYCCCSAGFLRGNTPAGVLGVLGVQTGHLLESWTTERHATAFDAAFLAWILFISSSSKGHILEYLRSEIAQILSLCPHPFVFVYCIHDNFIKTFYKCHSYMRNCFH